MLLIDPKTRAAIMMMATLPMISIGGNNTLVDPSFLSVNKGSKILVGTYNHVVMIMMSMYCCNS